MEGQDLIKAQLVAVEGRIDRMLNLIKTQENIIAGLDQNGRASASAKTVLVDLRTSLIILEEERARLLMDLAGPPQN